MVNQKKHLLTITECFIVLISIVLLSSASSYAEPPAESPQPPQDVKVVNPDSGPVPTYDVDNPALQPVHDILFCTIESDTSSCCQSTKTIPDGKRMVIELVTADGVVMEGLSTSLDINTTTSTLSGAPNSQNHEILLSLAASSSEVDEYRATQPVQLYADSGTVILMTYCRELVTETDDNMIVSISGYLVDTE